MTFPYQKGQLCARLAAHAADLRACQGLRHLCFYGRAGADADPLDPAFQHLMIHDRAGVLRATLRFRLAQTPRDLAQGYVAQYYDLSGWDGQAGPFLEIGRFCTARGDLDADLLRMLWGALTRIVDRHRVQLLFGCTSFAGTDPAIYGAAFQRLLRNHQGPDALLPAVTAAQAVRLADIAPRGIAPMPALLKSYLSLGGWVGDHAVIDPAMNTLHVFTCLPVAAMSAARVARLRTVAS
ncbi:ornithine-acyl[acyl carrier protein] N-acyltransferase [Yoonia tamlensis]|uniref:L-ornithine N(alpha)-acyltransferase n=1 Tax=Yoonia tamlensis TaxID=390270 RepID=A0A1I6GFJ8_9RHOB|nr:GNAT family N-acyltransferase [Yoonia tamlensis]SFR40972.1 ornithine-acyl[acyl carrier protein] N-acyltransferase [Yoonia tamlensis]